MGILFFAAVQAEPVGQMVKMEAKHETNAIFAFTTLASEDLTKIRFLFGIALQKLMQSSSEDKVGTLTSETLVLAAP